MGSHVPYPRACRRCKVVKPPTNGPDGFPAGRERPFSYVCWPCVEAEAWMMKDVYIPQEKRRTTRVVDGVMVRRCSGPCRRELPLETSFYVNTRDAEGNITGYNYECASCGVAKSTALTRIRREGPMGAAMRERKARQAREIRRRDPEKHRQGQKRWVAKVKANPRRHAEYAEHNRIRHRLRREKEGKSVTRSYRNVLSVPDETTYLPAEPLVAFIGARIEQREAVNRFVGEQVKQGGVIEAVCESLGISSRTYREWRSGRATETRFDTVEKVILAAGVEWTDVYSYDDHPDVYTGLLAGVAPEA